MQVWQNSRSLKRKQVFKFIRFYGNIQKTANLQMKILPVKPFNNTPAQAQISFAAMHGSSFAKNETDTFVKTAPVQNPLGSKENPYKINFAKNGEENTTEYLIQTEDGTYYSITDVKQEKEDKAPNGILKEHASTRFSATERFFQQNEEAMINGLKREYAGLLNRNPEVIWFEEKLQTVGPATNFMMFEEFLRGVKCGTIDPKKYFPTEDSYIRHVLKNIKSMEDEERAFLLTWCEPYKNNHVLYRGIRTEGKRKTGTLAEHALSSKNVGDTVIVDYAPMHTTTNPEYAAGFMDKGSKLLRIEVPAGAHLPWTDNEILLPSKSEFEYMGKEKTGSLEIINLKYLPFKNDIGFYL